MDSVENINSLTENTESPDLSYCQFESVPGHHANIDSGDNEEMDEENGDNIILDPCSGFSYRNSELSKLIKGCKECVDELIIYKTEYVKSNFKIHIYDRDAHLSTMIDSALTHMDTLVEKSNSGSYFQEKPEFLILRAKCYNITEDLYFVKAEVNLVRACKLQPSNDVVWMLLGEQYWKHVQFSLALECFDKAYCINPLNDKTLRSLSMSMRQIAQRSYNRAPFIERGVEYAKMALNLNFDSGANWLNLGNAYLAQYFICGQLPNLLGKAITSYIHSIKHDDMLYNADLYYSIAMAKPQKNGDKAYHYNDDYELALKYYMLSIDCDPTWSLPKSKYCQLTSYLLKVMEEKENRKFKLFTRVTLKDLQIGNNNDKVVVGRVLFPWKRDDTVSYYMILADGSERVCVNIYNLDANAYFSIGDTLCIPNPRIDEVKVTSLVEPIEYRYIRVNSPIELVINNRRLNANKVVATSLTSYSHGEPGYTLGSHDDEAAVAAAVATVDVGQSNCSDYSMCEARDSERRRGWENRYVPNRADWYDKVPAKKNCTARGAKARSKCKCNHSASSLTNGVNGANQRK